MAQFVVFTLIMMVVIYPAYRAYLFVRPPRFRITYRTPADVGLAYEDVYLKGSGGTRLLGWYTPSQNGAAVLLLHRHGRNRLSLMRQAALLAQAGYGVLWFDLRAHGNSGGDRFGHSRAVVEDVLAAVSYLSKRREVQPGGVGIYGQDFGGTLALQAAARTVAVRALMLDGVSPAAMADLPPPRSVWERGLQRPLQSYYLTMVRRWTRTAEGLPPNVSLLERLAGRSLLFVDGHTRLAQRVLRYHYECAPGQKDVYERSPEGTAVADRRRLLQFFNEALLHQEKEEALAAATAVVPDPETAEEYDATISGLRVNLVALAILPLVFFLFVVPFGVLWGRVSPQSPPSLLGLGLILLSFLVGIGVHELLHGVGYVLAGGVPGRAVKFGFSWKMMAPYAHCREPMKARAYRIAVALPGVILGLLPAMVGLAVGSSLLLLWGALMTVAAGGDLAVLLAIRGVPSEALVRDHPTLAGCKVMGGDGR